MNDTNYNFNIGKSTWSVNIIGKTGRVYVTKTSLPRHMRFGKCFENMEQPRPNYKMPDMKMHWSSAALDSEAPTDTPSGPFFMSLPFVYLIA